MKIFVPLWAASTAYAVDDGVEYQGSFYRCTIAHTSTSTFDPTKFTLITQSSGYTSDTRDTLYSDNMMAVDLVEFHLPTPVYLCSGPYTLAVDTPTAPTPGTNNYTAQGEFIGFSNLSEDFDVKVGKFTVYLTGLTTLLEPFTDPENTGKRVVIYKCFVNITNGQIIDRPLIMFDGQINNVQITESARSCSISIDCASIFADFERNAGRKTNNESNWLYQKVKYDTTFEKTGLLKNTEIKWGRV